MTIKEQVVELDEYLVNLGVPSRGPLEPSSTKDQQHKIWKLGYDNEEQIKALGKDQAIYLIDALIALEAHQQDYNNKMTILNKRSSKTKLLLATALISFVVSIVAQMLGEGWPKTVDAFAFLIFIVTLIWGLVSAFKQLKLKWKFRNKKMVFFSTNVKPRKN